MTHESLPATTPQMTDQDLQALEMYRAKVAADLEELLVEPETKAEPVPEVIVSRQELVPVPQRRRLETGRRAVSSDAELDITNVYLKQIGKYALLTKDEEISLSKRVQAGLQAHDVRVTVNGLLWLTGHPRKPQVDKKWQAIIDDGVAAHKEFTNANLRLVVSIAKRYTVSGEPLLDLIQDGNRGLMHAVDKFDWRKGFKFSTYATWWIKQAISRGLAEKSQAVRLPVHKYEKQRALQSAQSKGMSDSEIMELLSISKQELKEFEQLERLQPVSLNQHIGHDSDDAELNDYVGDANSQLPYVDIEAEALEAKMYQGLSEILSEKELRIVVLRLGLFGEKEQTLDKTATTLTNEADAAGQPAKEVTRERVRQVQFGALTKLRHPVSYGIVRSFLDVEGVEEWKLDANCAGIPPQRMVGPFDTYTNKKEDNTRVCDKCPVQSECLELALEIKAKSGIWAGKTITQKGKFV